MKSINLVLIILFLQSCASIKTPERHYYRLPMVNESMLLAGVKNTVELAVADFSVTGMLNNRNLLFIDSNKPNELKQFNFHFWDGSVNKILTAHFINYLKLISDDSILTKYNYSVKSGYYVKALVHVMEIEYHQQQASPNVSVDFQLFDANNKLVFEKNYKSKKSHNNKEIYSLVTSYNSLFLDVYNKFISDISSLKLNQ